ncbi:MAG: ubiquinol-cytochrome c reductase iron-sulfur subunit [Actinomycetota bacterium]|nr:ubiquinol-cytochrome c reductase iron-sulfur subunit [Actinomycetota bacterium]
MKPGRSIGPAFGVSALASLALTIVYLNGGQPQAEGALLAVALGGIAYGLVVWAKELMPGGHAVQERHEHASSDAERDALDEDAERSLEEIQRRTFLGRMLTAAVGALGLAALFPIRSFGSSPGSALFHTAWTPGARVVDDRGVAVRADDLLIGGAVTVFPEGNVGSADAQAILIKVGEGEIQPLPGREEWTPSANVAYSKICTHAGCPVGLYEQDRRQLLCPCHQSVFDVLRAAAPTAGPAARPLPQLPLEEDEEGYLVARGDFSEPVGPGFWNEP